MADSSRDCTTSVTRHRPVALACAQPGRVRRPSFGGAQNRRRGAHLAVPRGRLPACGSRRPASTRSQASLRLSLANTAASMAPPGRGDPRSSASPCPVAQVVEHERGHRVIDRARRQRRNACSAAAHGGRSACCQASMAGDRSVATTWAPQRRSAALAAPVPAPASRTTCPLSRCGLVATSAAAIGRYTSSAPSAQRVPEAA